MGDAGPLAAAVGLGGTTVGHSTVFTLTDVTLRRGAAVVLERISVRVESATCVGLVGRSGAGKSSLLGLLTRLDDPDSGRITFHDRPLGDHDVLDLRRKVQLVPQQPVLVTGRVVDEVRLGRPDLDLPAVVALLARVDLPPSFTDRETKGLSGGEVQRVALARALAMDPEVVLMDEPTAALDAETTTAIEHTVRDLVARGGTVVLVSHDAAQIRRVTERAITLEHGRLVESPPEDDAEEMDS
jgi:putative ABC transport system ATP-binding protein